MGVIINKVLPEKFDKINKLIRKGLERKKIDVLGVVPFNPKLSYPTIGQIQEETKFKLLFGRSLLDNKVSRTLVGAMQPKDAAPYFAQDCLLITPGDRIDILRLALEKHKIPSTRIAGVVLTGGLMPDEDLLNSFKEESIPVLLSKLDTYTVASKVYDMTVKIRPRDKEKIDIVVNSIRNYVDVKKILKRM